MNPAILKVSNNKSLRRFCIKNLSIPDGVTSLGEDGALSSQRFKNLIEIEIKYYFNIKAFYRFETIITLIFKIIYKQAFNMNFRKCEIN